MKKIYIIFFLLIVVSVSSAQDTAALKYFPIKIGNTWVYNCTNSGGMLCNCLGTFKVKVTQTIQKYGKFYFIFSCQGIVISTCQLGCRAGGIMCDTLRLDSVTCNIYRFSENNVCPNTPHEIFIDSLKARLNDTINFRCGTITDKLRCSDTSNITLFGVQYKTKTIGSYAVDSHTDHKYAKGIGSIGGTGGAHTCFTYHTLKGCVLNGVKYGDTSFLVGVNNSSSFIPDNYYLFQNYPNSFNPTTKIKFDIGPPLNPLLGKEGTVTLKVYDVLGKEVANLIPHRGLTAFGSGGQEGLKPGTYEVEWDGENYPSGVYFYSLTAGDFTQTKKMVLIK